MKARSFLASLLFVLSLPSLGFADDDPNQRPPSGNTLLIWGGGLTLAGLVSFAVGTSLCASGAFLSPSYSKSECLTDEIIPDAIITAVGLPLLIVGAMQHATYNQWRKDHPIVTAFTLMPAPRGAAAGWRVAF